MEVTFPVIFNCSLFTANMQIALACFFLVFQSLELFFFFTFLASTDVLMFRYTTESKKLCTEHQVQYNFAKLTLLVIASDAKHF